MHIRQETETDYPVVEALIAAAFRNVEHSDQTEPSLVRRLRKSAAFVPELSLVAVVEGEIKGHILLTKIEIIDGVLSFHSLALAPVSVLPSAQNTGIGSQLILEAHRRALALKFTSVVLLGDPAFYSRFGYETAKQYGIDLPFEVPSEYCMAKEMTRGALEEVQGLVKYDPAFFTE